MIAPQLLGGAYGWGISIITVMVAASCIAAAVLAMLENRRVTLDAALLLGAGALGWTLVQALPLPLFLMRWLEPEQVQHAEDIARLLGSDGPGWMAMSLDPAATRVEIVKGAAILAALTTGWLLAVLGHRRMVVIAVAASTVAMALNALGHLAAGYDHVFGVYRQVHTASALPASLVNQNHLAGFLSMGAPVLVGLALDTRDIGERIAWLATAVLVAATSLLAISRGGAASLIVGLLAIGLFGLLGRRRRDENASIATSLLLLASTIAAAVGLGLYVSAETIYSDFEGGDYSKWELGAKGLEIALDSPIFGVGRGAFSAAMVAEHGHELRYTHPENIVAQWVSEWGLPVATALFAIFAFALVRAVRTSRSWTQLGAAAGVVAIVTHDLVDFSLEMLGVSVVAAALFGAVIAGRRVESSSSARSPRPWRFANAAGIVAIAAVIVFGWRIDDQNIYAQQAELEDAIRDDNPDEFLEELREAVRAHPAEPTFVLLAGTEAVNRNDDAALAWLNRAMEMAPGWSAPHEQAARFLVRRQRLSQAFVELRRAEELRPGSGYAIACAALQTRPSSVDALIRSARGDEEGRAMLDGIANCLPLDSPAALAIDARLRAHDLEGARLRSARRAIVGNDADRAIAVLAPLAERRSNRVVLARAEAESAAGRPMRAADILRRAAHWSDEPQELLPMRARALAAAGDARGMRRVLDEMRGHAAGSGRDVAATWVLQGELEEGLGNDGHAIQAYERAARLHPDGSGLANAARVAERLGNLGRSYGAYSELCRRDGAGSPHCGARERVRTRMIESSSRREQPLGTP